MTSVRDRIDWNGVQQRLTHIQSLDGTAETVDRCRLSEILHQRAERLAQRCRENVSPGSEVAFLTFHLGSQQFGIELAHVKQVFPRVPISIVPGADKLLLGVANLNGSLHSIVDLRVLLSLQDGEPDAGYIILLRVGGTLLGIWAEIVDEVSPIDTDRLMAVDEAVFESIGKLAMGVTDDRILALDAALLIEHVREQKRRHADNHSAHLEANSGSNRC